MECCEYQPEQDGTKERLLKDIVEAEPKWFDSHPTYTERVAAVEQFPTLSEPPDMTPATGLITEFEKVEEQLTEVLTRHIHSLLQMAHQQANQYT
jgi:hypothetical protein